MLVDSVSVWVPSRQGSLHSHAAQSWTHPLTKSGRNRPWRCGDSSRPHRSGRGGLPKVLRTHLSLAL